MHYRKPCFVLVVTLCTVVFAIVVLVSHVQAAKVQLAWDAATHNTDGTPLTDLAGYTIYYWQANENFLRSIAVDGQTTHTVIDLEVGKTYQFTITAFNTSGAESVFANEVSTFIVMPLDTDGDGLTDEEEQTIYGTDPAIADTDGDGLRDGDEVALWGAAWAYDADGDGLPNLLDVDADNDGLSDEQEFVSGSDPADPALMLPSVTLWLEAETGQLLFPMEVGTDPTATAGQYVWVPGEPARVRDSERQGGVVHYRFSVPMSGSYVIWGRVSANSTTDKDSFYIALNDDTFFPWHVSPSEPETWGWDVISERHHLASQGFSMPFLFALEAGEHTLVVHQREAGIKLDRLLITNDLTLIPSDTGQTQ